MKHGFRPRLTMALSEAPYLYPNDGYGDYHEEDDDWDHDDDVCPRCGGEGSIEYDDAGPGVWMEDSPSEENHMIACPRCHGNGSA